MPRVLLRLKLMFALTPMRKKMLLSSKKSLARESQSGGVLVEFTISFAILSVVLFYCFDVGQRICQLSWANQINYVATFFGSESTFEKRSFVLNKLISQGRTSSDYNARGSQTQSLISAQNKFWKMKPLTASNVAETARPNQHPIEYAKIQTFSQGIWNPILGSSNMTTEFRLYTANNMNAIIHPDYESASNVKVGSTSEDTLSYNWCGELCGGSTGKQCPNAQDQGYVASANGPATLIGSCI